MVKTYSKTKRSKCILPSYSPFHQEKVYDFSRLCSTPSKRKQKRIDPFTLSNGFEEQEEIYDDELSLDLDLHDKLPKKKIISLQKLEFKPLLTCHVDFMSESSVLPLESIEMMHLDQKQNSMHSMDLLDRDYYLLDEDKQEEKEKDLTSDLDIYENCHDYLGWVDMGSDIHRYILFHSIK